MPFLGKTPTVGNFILLDAITVSNTATFALTKDTLDYYPGSAQNMIVSVNGVTQAPLTAYTITDSNIIFSSALDSDVDVIDYILVLGDTLNIGRPSDSTVGATQIQDYAVTSVKMSNTGVGAATYGTSTSIPQITIDAAGRITSATGIDRSNQFEDLTVTGNLTVSGNTVTVDAQTLSVEDPLIHLAANNETSDVVDIGFVGHYSNDGGTTKLHTGFFRDASDEQYYLFNGFEDDNLDLSSPSTTIDRTANTFALANLNTGKINATVDSNIAAAFSSTTTTAKITLADANDQAFIDINASRIGIGHSSSTSLQALQIEPTSAEAMRIDSSGNVGIGNNSPVELLHVYDGNILIEESDASAGSGLVIKNDSANQLIIRGAGSTRTNPGAATGMPQIVSTSGYDLYIAADGPDDVIFTTDRTERMRIADGGVNIGTGAPDSNITFGIDNQGFVVARYNLTAGVPTAGLGGVFSAAANVTDFSSGDLVLQCRPGVNGRSIKFFTGNTSAERMRIEADGNVGIGVSSVSPVISSSKTLQINSSGNTTLSVRAVESVNDRSAILELLSSGNGASKSIILYGDTDTSPSTASPLVIQKYHSGARAEVARFTDTGNLRLGDSTSAFIDIKSGIGTNNGGIRWRFNSDASVYGSLSLPYDTRATTGLHLYSAYPITYTVPSNKAHQFVTGSSEAARIDADGMKFNGDTAAANALDDYEEGTWEPQLIGSSSNPSVTYHADTGGKYVKIGQLVYLTGTVRTTAISGGSGQLWIANIPFSNGTRTNGDNSDGIGAANCVLWNGTSNRKPTTIKSKHNDTALYIYSGSHDQVDNILNVGDWGSTCQMSFTIVMWTN